MTMNKVFAKLRRGGKENYTQIRFCFTFAMILIATFTSIIGNSAVKNVLPQGGDSIKQVYMIFGIATIGCLIFTLYAGGLFLRYKSKEIGVFLALGTPRKKLAKALYGDLFSVIAKGIFIGAVAGSILAFVILKSFQLLFTVGIESVSIVSIGGIAVYLLFGCVVGCGLFMLASKFMRKVNIMDIINEERKSEGIQKELTVRYLLIGIASLILGLLTIGVIVPTITRLSGRILGVWTNVFFLFVIWGMYRIFVYAISIHKRGRNPQKYYKNIIAYSMLKFSGRSIVKNMLVITLLIICSLFACLYTPTKYLTEQRLIKANPIDFSFSYLQDANPIDEKTIYELADESGVEITDYHEIEFIRLLGSGVNRDNVDSKGNLIEKYEKQLYYYSFMSASQYEQATGNKVDIKAGHYKMLTNETTYENIYNRYGDLDYVENTDSNTDMPIKYDGTVDGNGLVDKDGFQALSRFVISDHDYEELKKELPANMLICNVIFNVKDIDASYPFALKLYKKFCESASANMLHLTYYDEYQEEVAIRNDEYYGYEEAIEVNAEHPEEFPDWKYSPSFKILEMKNGFISFAVFYLLFIVVTIICFAAVGVISYTRSLQVAVSNKNVFDDVHKLGANEKYLSRTLKGLIKNIYILPTIIAGGAMLIWYPLTLWQNDGRLTVGEVRIIIIEIALCAFGGVYQYILYRKSVQGAKRCLGLTRKVNERTKSECVTKKCF